MYHYWSIRDLGHSGHSMIHTVYSYAGGDINRIRLRGSVNGIEHFVNTDRSRTDWYSPGDARPCVSSLPGANGKLQAIRICLRNLCLLLLCFVANASPASPLTELRTKYIFRVGGFSRYEILNPRKKQCITVYFVPEASTISCCPYSFSFPHRTLPTILRV